MTTECRRCGAQADTGNLCRGCGHYVSIAHAARTPQTPCYHVDATDGLVYGVAAHNKAEAKTILTERLRGQDDGTAHPIRAEHVGTWDADYGTCLCYGPSVLGSIGDRVRLLHMPDDPDPLPDGTEGVIDFIDDAGTRFIRWDNGRNIGLLPRVDEWEVIQ